LLEKTRVPSNREATCKLSLLQSCAPEGSSNKGRTQTFLLFTSERAKPCLVDTETGTVFYACMYSAYLHLELKIRNVSLNDGGRNIKKKQQCENRCVCLFSQTENKV